MAEPFDMSLVQRGARNRRTPYYEATQKYGPKGFTVYNHMYFPIRFDSFEKEFDALLNDVTLWDVSVERCLEISGPDGFTVRAAAHAARPVEVRGRSGEVRADLSTATAASSTTRCSPAWTRTRSGSRSHPATRCCSRAV